MRTERRRKYACYPDCFGKLSLEELLAVSRRHGMQCIAAYKPDMHVHNEIGLYGTPTAMRATLAEWHRAGHATPRHKPVGAFGLDLRVQPKQWLDHQRWSGQRKKV